MGSHHTGNDIDTKEFRIVWDADWLANIPEEFSEMSGDKLKVLIDKVFKTTTGLEMANKLYLND